jgi:putative ATPase
VTDAANQQPSLFGEPPPPLTVPQAGSDAPLAARMRPRTLAEFVGQDHLIGPHRALRQAIAADLLPSLILWGPPGSGKTSLAEVIARLTRAHFIRLSAVTAGIADLRKAVEEAGERRRANKQRTILFIDEIHRFNRAQQDAILPHVERGILTLIGATTENPSFAVNSALLSRCRVYVLHPLTEEHIALLLDRALADGERGLGKLQLTLMEDARQFLISAANGDARVALNALELAATAAPVDAAGRRTITPTLVEDAIQHRALLYDKAGDQHYDLISALHKSLRGSDPDASLYWLGRILEAGEDPLYIARRLIRFASEDVGMADPQALLIAVAAQQAVHFVGMPEGALALAQAVVYLATAPKSNALYRAYSRVLEDIHRTQNEPVPLHLRNHPTRLMKDLGYGKDYRYAHDYYRDLPLEDSERPPHQRLQDYLPENLRDRRYYTPTDQGQERSIQRWLARRHQDDQDNQ